MLITSLVHPSNWCKINDQLIANWLAIMATHLKFLFCCIYNWQKPSLGSFYTISHCLTDAPYNYHNLVQPVVNGWLESKMKWEPSLTMGCFLTISRAPSPFLCKTDSNLSTCISWLAHGKDQSSIPQCKDTKFTTALQHVTDIILRTYMYTHQVKRLC